MPGAPTLNSEMGASREGATGVPGERTWLAGVGNRSRPSTLCMVILRTNLKSLQTNLKSIDHNGHGVEGAPASDAMGCCANGNALPECTSSSRLCVTFAASTNSAYGRSVTSTKPML